MNLNWTTSDEIPHTKDTQTQSSIRNKESFPNSSERSWISGKQSQRQIAQPKIQNINCTVMMPIYLNLHPTEYYQNYPPLVPKLPFNQTAYNNSSTYNACTLHRYQLLQTWLALHQMCYMTIATSHKCHMIQLIGQVLVTLLQSCSNAILDWK